MTGLLGAFFWSFEFQEPRVHREGEYLVLEAPEAWSYELGAPEIPAYGKAILLPPGTRAAGAEFEASEPVVIAKGLPRPSKAVLKIGEEREVEPLAEFYSAKGPLPGKAGEFLGTQWFSGQAVALLRLYPVQWNPQTREFTFYRKIKVKIELEPAQPPTPAPRVLSPLGLKVRRLLAQAFVNPEDLALPAAITEPSLPPPPDADPKLHPGPVDYVVITSSQLAPAFGELVHLKNLMGITATLVTTEWINSNYPGADLQERIRNFIRDAYLQWGVTWVLLGGNTDHVPIRYVNTGFNSEGDPVVPSEWYYSCLDGTWNADRDETYGEAYVDSVDYIPEVLIARAYAENFDQASLFVRKFEKYQFHPGPLLKRAVFVGPQLFQDPYDGERHCESIRAQFPEDFESLLFYWRFHNTNPDTIFAEVSKGIGVWFSISHGSMDRLYLDDGEIHYPDFDTLRNWEHMPVAAVVSCLAGAYDLPGVLLTHAVTAPEGGFVAVRSVTRNGYANCVQFDSLFFKAFFNQNEVGLAGYDFLSRIKYSVGAQSVNIMRYLYLSYGLLGDPALFGWADSPYYLEVQAPSSLSVGRDTFTVIVKNRSGFWVPNARVVLYKPGELYERRLTDSQGRAQFDVVVPSAGPIYLGVFKAGYVPWVDTLDVGASGPWLSVLGAEPADDNGIAEPGDTLPLLYTVKNGGSAEAEGVEVHLASASGFIQVLEGTDSLPRLSPNSSVRLLGFKLAIGQPPSAEAYAELRFTFLKGGDTLGYDTAHIPVYAPEIERWRWRLEVDTVGLLAKFWPGLLNDSKAELRSVSLSLTSTSPDVQVIASPAALMDVPAGEARLSSQPFTLRLANPGALDGATLKLVVSNSFLAETLNYLIKPVDERVLWLWGSPDSASITLLWNPPSDTFPWGYLVWRAERPEGPYELVSVKPPHVASYTDYSVEPYKEYWYKVSVIDSFYNQGPLSPSVRLTTYLKREPGWPQWVHGTGRMSPLVFDLDPTYPGDEIVLVTTDIQPYRVYAFHFDGTPVPGWPVDIGAKVWSDIAGGDIDGDGYGEVVVRTTDSIYVFNHDGSRHQGWPKAIYYVLSRYQWPVLYDLDGDGKLEIIVSSGGGIWVWREDGTGFLRSDGLFFQHPTGEGYSFHNPSVGDVDHDGVPEIVVPYETDLMEIWVLESDGSVTPGFPVMLPRSLPGAAVAIGDVAPNVYGEELVLTAYDGDRGACFVYCVALSGDTLWSQRVDVMSRTDILPTLADVDGDDVPEVLVPGSKDLYVFDGDGRPMTAYSYEVGRSAFSMITAGDVDGDGWVEYFYANITSGTLFGFRRGIPIEGMPIHVGIDNQATPSIGDFDGDGKAEIVHSNVNTQLHVFEFYGGPPGRMDWPQVKHDPWRTSWLGAPVDAKGRATPEAFELKAPTVVKGAGSLTLSLPFEARVKLEVFDISGRLAEVPFDGKLAPGVHSLRWSPKASGVYVLRLLVNGREFVKKAVSVR